MRPPKSFRGWRQAAFAKASLYLTPGVFRARLGLRQAPDARGRYSTRQIIDACFDNQYQHRSALLAAQTEKLAIQNAVKRGELVPVKEVKAFWGKAATTLRPLILAMTAPGNCKSAMIS